MAESGEKRKKEILCELQADESVYLVINFAGLSQLRSLMDQALIKERLSHYMQAVYR